MEDKTIKFKVKAHKYVPLDDLKPFQGELKKLSDENHSKLRKQILESGFNFSPHIWEYGGHNYILDGHQRLFVLKQLKKEGYEVGDIPVNVVEANDFNDAKKKVLQAVSQYGKVDPDGFEDFTADVDFDLSDFDIPGFETPDIDLDEKEGNTDPDDIPDVQENIYDVKRGDIWQLGNHRIMCGDSTNKDDVEKLMNGEKADMVFTDPPYGINLDTDYSKMPGTNTTYKNVIGDDRSFDPSFMFKILKPKSWYIWGADYFFKQLPDGGNLIIWSKRFSDDETKTFGSGYEVCWTYPKQKKDIWFVRGINQSSERLGEHPTQKPTELAIRAFEKSNPKTVLDLFLGSGSTLIACEKTNRRCFGMEIDPHYCSVIIKRFEEYTGEKAIKLD